MPTAKARGKVTRGLGRYPSLMPSDSPARRNNRSRLRIKSRWPISAVPTVLKIECVLAVEPLVRINLLRQDKSGGKLYFR